jgi:hypothetical protein
MTELNGKEAEVSDLTNEERKGLIEQLCLISTRLTESQEGPARDDVKEELRQVVRLLWLDGKPEPG